MNASGPGRSQVSPNVCQSDSQTAYSVRKPAIPRSKFKSWVLGQLKGNMPAAAPRIPGGLLLLLLLLLGQLAVALVPMLVMLVVALTPRTLGALLNLQGEVPAHQPQGRLQRLAQHLLAPALIGGAGHVHRQLVAAQRHGVGPHHARAAVPGRVVEQLVDAARVEVGDVVVQRRVQDVEVVVRRVGVYVRALVLSPDARKPVAAELAEGPDPRVGDQVARVPVSTLVTHNVEVGQVGGGPWLFYVPSNNLFRQIDLDLGLLAQGVGHGEYVLVDVGGLYEVHFGGGRERL